MEPIRIQVRKVIRAKKWKILRLLSRVEDFQQFLPHIRECRVLEKKTKAAVTYWQAEIEGIPLSWIEEDTFDFANFTIHFKLIKGDLESLEGKWTIKDHPDGGSEVVVDAAIRIGIPVIEQIIGDTLQLKFTHNFEQILSGMSEMLSMKRYKNIHSRAISDIKGFGIIAHPYNLQHLIRFFKHHKPDFKLPSQDFLVQMFALTPPYRFFDIKEFRSKTGKKTHGYFIMCPIIPDMLHVDAEKVLQKVIESCKVAEDLGVGICALGGFASIAGESFGRKLTSKVNVPMTTGNTLTVALTLEGIYKAARLMNIDLESARVAIIGGAGDIGGACARILSEQVSEITITGRSEKNLMDAERILSYYGRARIKTSHDNNQVLRGADIVIAAASVSSSIIDFSNFKPGAVICDVGYPKNISYTACDRKDIFIFSGGITALPTEIDLGYDTGLPSPNVLYGCFAEAIVLDLEERYENFSWGRGSITKEKVEYILGLARKHGFDLAPFFWGNNLVKDEEVVAISKSREGQRV
ncbi:MAG: SRPBCC family protein [Candidatus Omnitrophota bacterium]|nr:SRPBCC family protein [Candidatus Omnitrophota bacterium]